MTEKEFERLVRNLELEDDGKEIARRLNELLVQEKTDLLKLHLAEAQEETSEQRQETELTPREEAVLRIVRDTDDPLAATDLVERVDEEFPGVGEQFRSLHHRSHASSILNSLVEMGLLGKMRYRNTVYYVEPEEAVRQWFKEHGNPEEFSAKQLADDTGLPLATVNELLQRF